MKLLEMRPAQIKAAVDANLPMVLACGVVEYHGPHLPVGTDWLMASTIVEQVEKRIPDACVLAPGFPFGPTGEWAGGPSDGELHIDGELFFHWVKPVLAGYLAMGFRRILVCQHHQGSEGSQHLCLKRAAAELALEEGRQRGGAGWGRFPDQSGRPSVFGRIQILHYSSFLPKGTPDIGCGHGSYGETTYLMGCRPDLVDLPALDQETQLPRWLLDSHKADSAAGRSYVEACITSWTSHVASLSNHAG